jgi:DNA polymerase III alpha subunit
MSLIPSFVARKHGREEVKYPHSLAEPILSETYGIMVYQEQVMQIAQVLGGYSLGGADLLRRAMGKKKADEMALHRSIFRKGAEANSIATEQADAIFDLMEEFAGYGFNKSHAAAYSLLAYHTAWIKVHFTAEFFCANMTVEMDDTDKLKILFDDAKSMGLQFDRPDVNTGVYAFVPVSENRIRYGLGAIKGTGQSAIEAIVQARNEGGDFNSLYDFCARVDRASINKRTVEALIKAGAFDGLWDNRAELLASVGLAFDYFAKEAVDIAVIETGLGGRLDSTNIITPILSIITNISLDHTDLLGHTETAIAFEKAGIMKSKVPVLIGNANQETMSVFVQQSLLKGSTLFEANLFYDIVRSKVDAHHQYLKVVHKTKHTITDIVTDMLGDFQLENIKTVMAACDILVNYGLPITIESIQKALSKIKSITGFMGRWHTVQQTPRVIMDVGHNVAGIKIVAQQLQQLKANADKEKANTAKKTDELKTLYSREIDNLKKILM